MMHGVVLGLLLAASQAGGLPWYDHYDRGVEMIEEGKAKEARMHLEAALAARPEPGRLVRTYGLRYVDYLPHLYLAVAVQMEGDVEAARAHLEACERWGVADQTEVGATLLSAYRLLIQPRAEEQISPDPGPIPGATVPSDEQISYRLFDRQGVVLDAEEVERVRHEISVRCGLSPEIRHPRLPWYFHYEMGLALARRGDPQRALDELIAAADQRAMSQHGARMYGMWFTDYLPYFAIAKAHAELGNWRCTLSALEVSSSMGEVTEDDEDYAAFRALMSEAQSRN